MIRRIPTSAFVIYAVFWIVFGVYIMKANTLLIVDIFAGILVAASAIGLIIIGCLWIDRKLT